MIPAQTIRARVVRHVQDGKVYYPIATDGHAEPLEQLGAWAHQPDLERPRAGGLRRARLILSDETPLRGGGPWNAPQGWRLRLTGLRWGFFTPLTFHATGLTIAIVEDIRHEEPGVVPGAVGHAITAVATFSDTVLASIAWQAIRDELFTGCCPVLLNPESVEEQQLYVGGDLAYVTLGDPASMCSPGARVLAHWEEVLERTS